MPHLVLAGELPWQQAAAGIVPVVRRWGRAVLKTDVTWVRGDGSALLVEGVVVELERPLHPVAVVALHHDDTIVRLWSLAPVERTDAVQRWLALLAVDLQKLGGGALKTTNIAPELWSDLGLAQE
jgi:hypothetical protein